MHTLYYALRMTELLIRWTIKGSILLGKGIAAAMIWTIEVCVKMLPPLVKIIAMGCAWTAVGIVWLCKAVPVVARFVWEVTVRCYWASYRFFSWDKEEKR
jgi:hypothetical protein